MRNRNRLHERARRRARLHRTSASVTRRNHCSAEDFSVVPSSGHCPLPQVARTSRGARGRPGGAAACLGNGFAYELDVLTNEIVVEVLAVAGNATNGRAREMNWQDECGGVGHQRQKAAARLCGLLLVGVEDSGPAGLPALERMAHHIAGHHCMLAAGADIDAAVMRRMAGRGGE